MIKKMNGSAGSPAEIIGNTKTSGNPELDAKFREVSQMYEKQFLREMTKAMRSTVQESGLVKVNQGERIFREQLDNEYVEKWGDKGGIGLADLIYDQMMFHYGPKTPPQKPQGPLPMNEKSNFTLNRVTPTPSGGNSFEFTKIAENPGEKTEVTSPWSGVLHQKLDLGPDEKFLEMWHDNGAKSKFAFKGLLKDIQPGQKIQEGESLGYLSPEIKNFFWDVSL